MRVTQPRTQLLRALLRRPHLNGVALTGGLRRAGTLDLERGVEHLIAAATSRASSGMSTSNGQPPAAQGLKLDLKLLDGGNTVELSGDVVVTTDGMAVTPSGMGFTPVGSIGGAASTAAAEDDWFASYSATSHAAAGRGGIGASREGADRVPDSARRPEDVAGLSPLLTPSNNKLCAALVDAF